MVAGPSCRMFLSPGLLTRYALCRPRLMARGQVRCLRSGLRFLFLVMSAMTRARAARACSGGKSRADGPADDAQGALELDPVRVDPGAGGGGADQGAERVAGQQVAPDLLLDQVRAPRAEHPAGTAQACLELGVAGLVFPALVVGTSERLRRGRPEAGDGGDQDEELVLAVALPVRDVVLDHPHVPCLVLLQCPAAPGRGDQ